MMVLLLINIKTFLSFYKCDAESYLGSEHHLGALHEVVDGVFEDGLESVWVNQVEIDFFISDNLESCVTFDVV